MTIEELEQQLRELNYPNGDRLKLNISYVGWRKAGERWQATLTGLQRRGLCEYVSSVGSFHYAETPELAAEKAVKSAPTNWGYEPDHIQLIKTIFGWEFSSIPLKR